MDAIGVIFVVVLLLIVLAMGYYVLIHDDSGHQHTITSLRDLSYALADARRYGTLFTRISISSKSSFTPLFEELMVGIARGSLQPLKSETELLLQLWRSDEIMIVISQNGRSVCVLRLRPDDKISANKWAGYITEALSHIRPPVK